MAWEVPVVELEGKVFMTWVAQRLKETSTIGSGGGVDSTCGAVLLLVREDGVGAACDGVGGRGGRDMGGGQSAARGFAGLGVAYSFHVIHDSI
jgi:hypothetical protein